MNLLLSILLSASALVAAATSGRDESNSPVNADNNKVRDIFNGGLILPGTSLVTVNNVVVATTSSDFGSSPVSTTIDQASAAASTLSDNFPPVSPGHSNVHSSIHDSTTVIFSTVTLPPTTSVAVGPVAPPTSLLSAVNEQGAALVSSAAATTSHSAPASSDVTQPLVLETSSLEPETVQPSAVQPSAVQPSIVESSAAPLSTVQPSIAESSAVQSSATPSTSQSSTARASTIQSSEAPILSVQPSASPSSTFESSSAQLYTFQPPVTDSSASPSLSVSSLPAQSLTIQPTSLESSTAQSTAESSISQVSAAPSLPTMSAISPAPFPNSTASLVQSLSSSVVDPSTKIVPVSSTSSPATSVIVGTSQTNSASLPTLIPTCNNVSSSAVSGIVGTTYSIISSSSPGNPPSESIGTTETTTTRTTTITSTTTRTGTITTTITRSSASITSQSIIGKLPVTGTPQAGLTTETFTSGGSTWTTTETGPPRTVTASLMLNPSLSASNNGGVLTSNGAAPSGACTCPSQVTVTVTATPFIATGSTVTGTAVTGSTASANSPEKSTSSSSHSTTYYQPPQESWTTHSVPGFIGVTIPSGGMSYPPKATTYPVTSSKIPSATYAATTPASESVSHTHPYMSIESTPNLSFFSNYSSTSTGSLLGTIVGTGVGTSITPSYHPTTRPSSGISPSTTSFKPPSPTYSGNAEINAVGTESVALIVGFVALVLLV
ncbi:hypothetical protein OCU04_011772 [Sclerotinia nivalis]|uniref:Uncharacterized protein n=1 Tax=Sclerotinia nivalis TaxID=352851 RepID=A0A9X0A9L2_9HELO|nr:hypothetical protein OCU04_011772 [Sclerotinia nivalis]